MESEEIMLFAHKDEEEKPLKWYEKLLIGIMCCLLIVPLSKMSIRSQRISKVKDRMKYFNPVIKKDFFGNEKVEWIGRDKPLTDEELNKLL